MPASYYSCTWRIIRSRSCFYCLSKLTCWDTFFGIKRTQWCIVVPCCRSRTSPTRSWGQSAAGGRRRCRKPWPGCWVGDPPPATPPLIYLWTKQNEWTVKFKIKTWSFISARSGLHKLVLQCCVHGITAGIHKKCCIIKQVRRSVKTITDFKLKSL